MSGNKWVYVILIAILFFSLLAMPTAGTSAEEVYTLVTLWPEFPQLWYFDKPYGIAVDGSGDVFVADVEKNQIQKVEIYQVASKRKGAINEIYFADARESPGSVYHYDINTGIEKTIYTRPSQNLYSFTFHPAILEKLYYVNANEDKIYLTRQLWSGWTYEEVFYTHNTYIRDIAFAFDENGELGLYFSESSGARANGKIYKIEDGYASLYYEVNLKDVGGSWAGNFAFDDTKKLYLSSGNRVPASIYKVEGGIVKEIYKDEKEPIRGFTYKDGSLYYANWRTKIYLLDLSTGERTAIYSNSARSWLSDVGFREVITSTLKPDLIIKDISWSPRSPDRGDTIEFAVKIKNQGSGSAGSSRVKYYIDGSYVGYDSVSKLSAGSTSYETFTWTANKCGDVKVKAVVDANNEVAETTEKNNDRTDTVSIKCPTSKPDLIIKDISWSPSSPDKGDTIEFAVKIMNQGSGPAGSSTLKFYIDGSYVGYAPISNFPAGSTGDAIFTLIVNKCGDVKVKAVADANNEVAETKEKNNDRTETVSIKCPTSKPDLIIKDISWSPSSPDKGDTIEFAVKIMNQGSGPAGSSTLKFYIDGSYVGYAPISNFPAGSTGDAIFTLIVNKCGDVKVKAVADANNEVAETKEKNNDRTETVSIKCPTSKPDLIIKDISWSPSSPDKGDTIEFAVKIMNQGSGSAGSSTVNIYIDGSYVGSDSVSNFPAGSTGGVIFKWTANKCGDVKVKAVADANNEVAETTEKNNDRTETVSIKCPTSKPDLIIKDILWSPSSPDKGDTMKFAVEIKNQGSGSAGSSTVNIYIDGSYVGYDSVSKLPAGSTTTITFTGTANKCGDVKVKAVADANNEVAETTEKNNDRTETVSIKCPTLKPDLIIPDISWSPSNPYAGDIIAFTVTIKNQGSGSAGSSTAKYYVDGSYVGYDSVPALSAASTTTQTFTWTANKCGTVQVKAVADANSDVQESDETNNEKQKSSEIYGPDLIVQEISWPSEPVCLDKPVTITVKVKNQGNRAAGASTVNYYVDNLPIDSDTILGLYSGSTSTQTFSWTPTICGYHNIKAVADANNDIKECDETNNEKQKSVHVVSPDLVIQSLTWAPTTPKKGDSITFTVTIKNQGDADADSSHVRLFIRHIEVDPVSASVGPIAAGSTVSKTFTWTADSCAKTAVSVIADADNEVDESREDNNYLPKTIYVKCPDLEIEITDISWSTEGGDLHAGDDMTISYKIMNNGEVDAEEFKTRIMIDSLPFRTFFTPSLSANTETIGVCTWKAVRGTHSIKVETDAQKKVEESDETNNEDRADIVVDEEPVDLIITGIEVTQAIQNLDGDVPLIEGKDTFVRVYMKTNSRSIPNVKGTLKGFRNSKPIGEITNLNKWNYIAKDSVKERPSIDERRSDDFYLLIFKLPDEWLSGDITIKVEIKPDPRRYTLEEICSCTPCERKLQFNKAGGFTIAFVPIHHNNTKPDFGDFEKVYQEFVKLYPISKDDVSIEFWPALEIDYNPTNNESNKCPWGNCGLRLLGDLQFLASYQTRKNSDQNLIVFGLVDSEVKSKAANHGGPLWGYGEMGDGKTFGTRCAWGIDGTFGGSYMAHGIGHNLGRKHIDCGGPKNIDPGWPYKEEECHLAPETPAGFWGFDVNERSVRAPSEYSDFMTYSAPYWVSNYTYTALFESIKERGIVSSLSKGSPMVLSQPEEIDMIIIHGFINISADEATFNNFFHRNGTPQDSSSMCQQRFEIQLQNLMKQVLVNHSFSISNADGSDIYDFVELVRYNSSTAYIVLKHNNTVLATVNVSDSAPNVTVKCPNDGGILFNVNVKIIWTACDPDPEDELHYTVDYSPDNGSTWLPSIAIDLGDEKYSWNTSDLQGSKEGLIRVTATDGVNTGRDRSDAVFTVLEKGPKVNITHPTNGTLITEGNYIKLIGSGHDLEDGMLNDSALTWNSSLNGDLGNGEDIETRNLTRGVHTITLMGEDSNVNRAYDSITISVLDSATIDTPKGTARLSATDGVIIGACRVNESILLPLPEVEFPFGVFNFNISNISSGQTVNISIELPQDLPSDTKYWMYGRTPENSSPHWYDDIKMEICEDNRTVTIQLIDGGKGDDDMYANETIVVTGAPGVPVIPIFDTKTPANPYPSVSGTHTGTITPIRDVNISTLYTYPCSGTCGHTESIELYENNTLIANGTWTGYIGDWHNITIAHNITGGVHYVTLLKTHKYNYTILTGSYPQIHHNSTLLTDNGWINCTDFTDSNGKRYYDWIPAIRLW